MVGVALWSTAGVHHAPRTPPAALKSPSGGHSSVLYIVYPPTGAGAQCFSLGYSPRWPSFLDFGCVLERDVHRIHGHLPRSPGVANVLIFHVSLGPLLAMIARIFISHRIAPRTWVIST
jgi:hypothetical protein